MANRFPLYQFWIEFFRYRVIPTEPSSPTMPKLEAVSRQEPLAAISFRFIQLTCVLEIATELKLQF
jgi:hypothetical protein